MEEIMGIKKGKEWTDDTYPSAPGGDD